MNLLKIETEDFTQEDLVMIAKKYKTAAGIVVVGCSIYNWRLIVLVMD